MNEPQAIDAAAIKVDTALEYPKVICCGQAIVCLWHRNSCPTCGREWTWDGHATRSGPMEH